MQKEISFMLYQPSNSCKTKVLAVGKNVLAFVSKKLQSNFFNAIIIGKENSSRLSHVVLNNMFIDNYN